MRSISLAVLLLIVSGCATDPATIKEVYIKVPVPCLRGVELPAFPEIVDDPVLLSLDDRVLVLTIAREREELIVYSKKLEAAITPCR